MIIMMENYTPMYQCKIVRWIPSPSGWLKCNIDRDSRGNPSFSVVAFYLRDHECSLVGAKGFKKIYSTDLVAEARAIREGLQYCLEK